MAVRRRKGLTLEEALAILAEDDDDEVEGIFIEPPESNVLTDEDSGDDDDGGLVDNLTGRQLRSESEIIYRGHKETSEQENESLSQDQNTKSQTFKKREKTVWKNEDLVASQEIFPEEHDTQFNDLSAVDVFEMILDEEILEFLCHQTTNYALFKNASDPKVSVSEMKVYLAILILSGYNRVPSKRSFWDSSKDLRNELVSSSMRRDRFLEICRFIHCADNNQMDQNDKMWKLRPFINLLKAKFIRLFEIEQHLCFDESMVEYFGRHSCKQFIRGKPIRFGYKVWCLNTQKGYLINFDIYQGKNPTGNSAYEKEFGKCAAPLVQMLDELPSNVQNLPFKLYFDNLFTGLPLLNYLKDRGYKGTGTIRENRIPKECPIQNSKEMKKMNRGSYTIQTSKNEKIAITRWVDNSVVTVASTSAGIEPVSHVSRYSKTEGKKITVRRPAVISEYNKYMGGTDKMDENLSYYRISVRGKKWWWPIFTWLIDVSIQNAWFLIRKSGANISQLDFRREIVNAYLRKYALPPQIGRSRATNLQRRINKELRFDGIGHLVIPCKRRRCASENCKSVVRTECTKCQVGLCIPCFVDYHKEK